MSLVIDIKINSQPLRTIAVTRQHAEFRERSEYRVTVYDHEAHTERPLEGLLIHYPGDGAEVLAQAALSLVVNQR